MGTQFAEETVRLGFLILPILVFLVLIFFLLVVILVAATAEQLPTRLFRFFFVLVVPFVIVFLVVFVVDNRLDIRGFFLNRRLHPAGFLDFRGWRRFQRL